MRRTFAFPFVTAQALIKALKVSTNALRMAAELKLIREGVDYIDSRNRVRVTRAYNIETLRQNWPAIAAQLPRKTPVSEGGRRPLARRIHSCRDYELPPD